MGNLGMPELIMIMVLALLLFGPKKLPEIGKTVGKALGEFKRASNDLKRTIEDEMNQVKEGIEPPSGDPPKPEPPALAPAAGTVAQQATPDPQAPGRQVPPAAS
jgi:sec-independent protein translocase protein TatA